MAIVKLDIAGMYFGEEILVEITPDTTVKDVMDAAVLQTAGNTGSKPTFSYSDEDVEGKRTVNTITVVHRGGSAKSRQAPPGSPNPRTYPNGVYSYSDDSVFIREMGLRALDPNKAFVLAWQYYVYDETGVDLARMRYGAGSRAVVPFGQTADKGYVLEDGYTVVWRLVAIFVRPTHHDLGEVPGREVDVKARVY